MIHPFKKELAPEVIYVALSPSESAS